MQCTVRWGKRVEASLRAEDNSLEDIMSSCALGACAKRSQEKDAGGNAPKFPGVPLGAQ